MKKVKAKVLKYMISENEVKRQVKDYLNATGWFNFHILQGMGAYKGIPDRIAAKNGKVLFIEVKKLGGKQSDNQKHFQECVEGAGGIYILVNDLNDIVKAIDKLEGR